MWACAFLVFSATITNTIITGSFWDPVLSGTFSTWGNAWVVSFDVTPAGYSWVEIVNIDTDTTHVYLTGTFWMQSVGWVTFWNVWSWWLASWSGWVEVLPPGSGSSLSDPWYLTGYAWSDNAGWISMGPWINWASWVALLPDTTTLTGYAWSDNLGWIPFYSGAVNIAQWFIGQVKVLGNIGGNKTFSTLYNPGVSFDTVTLWNAVNKIRKNISMLIRNAWISKINTNISNIASSSPNKFNDTYIYKYDANPSDKSINYSLIKNSMQTDKIRSLISIGADIYIDSDVVDVPRLDRSRVIIALKNDSWQWWNIYIKGTVKNIESSLIAEKSIWSWEDTGYGLSRYFIYKQSAFSALPKNQLYILGSAIWHNTIWGWIQKTCPYSDIIETCNGNTAIKYDWNYFRSFSGSNNAWRAYKDASLDKYSVIIEYDPRSIQDPPPGISTEIQ